MTAAGVARVVLLHGAWHRGACWDPVVAGLERAGVTVAAPDLPSDTPGAGHADLVAPVLAATGTDTGPVVLVGHSWGALVATTAAASTRRGSGRPSWSRRSSPSPAGPTSTGCARSGT